MSELSNTQIIFGYTLAITVVVEYVLPLLLWLGCSLIKFWFRLDKNPPCVGYMWNMWQLLLTKRTYSELSEDHKVFFGGFLSFFLTWGLGVVIASLFVATESVLGVGLVLIVLVLAVTGPRFVIDMIKALKYNKSTGDLERIDRLQKEMDELKSKIN